MTLTKWERKALIPFGAAADVARKLGVSRALVSREIAGIHGRSEKAQAIRKLLAKKAKRPVDELFPPLENTQEPVGGATEAPSAKRAA